tara:strand:+ start:7452 stop:8390 length:939 start_codon:yes stop_codon:yes gene_type:complete
MAINVNQVYKTVLLILNKEQRGYLTPDEFNKIATQVQLEIFESYFEELNQQYRLPDNNSEYADRLKNLREKISVFQEEGQCSYVGPYFSLPTNSTTAQTQSITTQSNSAQYTINQINAATLEAGQVSVTLADANGAQQPLTEGTEWTLSNSVLSLNPIPPDGRVLIVTVTDFLIYKLGTVIYDDEKEVQYVQPNELLELNLSPITKPTTYFPVYKYSDFQITVFPKSITSNISCTFLRKPLNPLWNFTGATSGDNFQYSYDATTSVGFELHPSEQTDLILKVLLYAGVVIKDPQIIQVAAQQIAADTQNEKS